MQDQSIIQLPFDHNDQIEVLPVVNILKYGPSEKWRQEWQVPWLWCKLNGAEDIFQLFVDVFNFQSIDISEVPFKNIIAILSTDKSCEIIEKWSLNDLHCSQIYQLVVSFKKDLSNGNNLMRSIAPASTSKLKRLPAEAHYLLTIFLDLISNFQSEREAWMDTFRIWVLIHSVYRAERGHLFDLNLKYISGYIRSLLYAESHDWNDFMRLMPGIEKDISYSSFNSELIHRIAALQSETLSRRFSRFLGAVERVAKDEDHGYKLREENHSQPLYTKTVSATNFSISKSDEAWIHQVENYGEATDNEVDPYAVSNVDPTDSYTHQKLSAKSRYLQTAEYLSYLPYSWNRPTSQELTTLNNWIDRSLETGDHILALLASFVWIALNTSRTLVRVLNFFVGTEPQLEWTLDPSSSTLNRMSPLREGSWSPDSQEEREWVSLGTKYNRIVLPEAAAKLLQKYTHDLVAEPPYLSNLWRRICDDEIEVVFNKYMTGPLGRLRSGMLANVLPQSTFDNSGDHNLAQMVSYHPQLSTSSALAYGSWDCIKVSRSTEKIHQCLDNATPKSESKILSFGSRFDPKEELLQEAIKNATDQITLINPDEDPIGFHNAYTCYLMCKLLAGTGGRPVDDAFESPRHFNLDVGYVFVNDKAVDQKHLGRLVPVPSSICCTLKDTYIQHLIYLAHALDKINSRFAKEINLLIQNKPSGRLAYFFYINPSTLDWERVSAESFMQDSLFHWPLRNNLFRQRYAKRLPLLGVTQEIVDAWMGHKDASIDSYGDFSIRSWLDDLRTERKNIDLAFESLGFKDIATWTKPPIIKSPESVKFESRVYGIRLRADNRKKRRCMIIKTAQAEIDSFRGNRNIAELDQDQMDRLEDMLTLLPNKMRHPNAFLRLNLLSRILDEQWKNKNKKFQVSRRVFQLNDELNHVHGASGFNHQLCQKLKSKFDECYSEITASRVSTSDSRMLAVFALMFENRLCYPRMLTDIYHQQSFRIIKYNNNFYLEYSEELDTDDLYAAVQRHRLTPKTAHLLNNLLKSKIQSDKIPEQLATLIDYVESLSCCQIQFPEKLIEKFSSIVNDANAIEFPGTVAAFLSGRVPSSSLNWHDLIRLDKNKIMKLPGQKEEDNKPVDIVNSILKGESFKYRSSISNTIEKQQLQDNAKIFYDEIRQVLNVYQPANRRSTISEISQLINQHNQRVSTAIVMVARWIRYQIKTGKSRGGKSFAESTPNRYFAAIAPYFEQLAYKSDLFAMESDEITELYSEFLLSTEHLKGTYHTDRLIEFHRYCVTEGVEHPDWDELELPARVRMTRPGIVTEYDYLKTLSLILSNTKGSRLLNLHMAFLLFLGFRFGLRTMEAIGLRREDWIEHNGSVYLLVRNNQLRKLKTIESRRMVPLLFDLVPKEQKLITAVMANYESLHHDDKKMFLFSDAGGVINSKMEIIRRSLIQLLKQVTGNPKMVVHHLRHSFTNSTSLSLYHIELKLWRHLMLKSCNPEIVRSISLGKQNSVSSRSTMAAARLLGHTHPRTDAISYQHFQDEWANTLAGIPDKPTKKFLDQAIDLNDFPMAIALNVKLCETKIVNYSKTSLSNLLRILSLVSNGKTFETAGRLLSIDHVHINTLTSIVRAVGNKEKSNADFALGHEWLSQIPRSAWKRMIAYAEKSIQKPNFEIGALVPVEEISNLIGKNRQLTLWQENHFHSMQKFLEFTDLPIELFTVASYVPDNPLSKLSAKYGFKINPNIRRADLVVGVSNETPPGHYRDRVNIIFRENKSHDIRNSVSSVRFSNCFTVVGTSKCI